MKDGAVRVNGQMDVAGKSQLAVVFQAACGRREECDPREQRIIPATPKPTKFH